MRGRRVPQQLAFAATLTVAVAVSAWAPVGAAAEECEPYTRSDLVADHAPGTTTTVTVDVIVPSVGRGVAPPDDDDPMDGIVPEPTEPAPTGPRCDFLYEIEYPLVGAGTFGSGFGAPRDGGARLHMGVDLMAPKMTPVVAAADATVSWVRNDPSGKCCYVGLTHDDGWESWYIHLNNDTYGTDDGLGVGVRPDLEAGDVVVAGEVIGWVGDSGNAETTDPHLHFELHLPSGEPIDAWPSVRTAQGDVAAALARPDGEGGTLEAEGLDSGGDPIAVTDFLAPRVAGERPSFVGPYVDDDGLAAEDLFASLTAVGVSVWCDEWRVNVCPARTASGDDAELWIAAVSGTARDPSVAIAYTKDTLDPGLDRGSCTAGQLCPDAPVTLGEVAAMLLGTTDESLVLRTDEAVAELARSGIGTCGPRDASSTLTRAELADLIVAFSAGGQGIDCTAVS